MVQHPVGDRLDPERLEHAEADLRMTLEHETLGIVQRPGLAQDLLGNRELAEIVEASRQADELDFVRLEAQETCYARGELTDHVRVAARVRVRLVNGVREAGRGGEGRARVPARREPVELRQLLEVR